MVFNFLPVALTFKCTKCTSFETIYFCRSFLKGDIYAKLSDSDEETQGSRRMRCAINVFL